MFEDLLVKDEQNVKIRNELDKIKEIEIQIIADNLTYKTGNKKNDKLLNLKNPKKVRRTLFNCNSVLAISEPLTGFFRRFEKTHSILL